MRLTCNNVGFNFFMQCLSKPEIKSANFQVLDLQIDYDTILSNDYIFNKYMFLLLRPVILTIHFHYFKKIHVL